MVCMQKQNKKSHAKQRMVCYHYLSSATFVQHIYAYSTLLIETMTVVPNPTLRASSLLVVSCVPSIKKKKKKPKRKAQEIIL